MLASAFTYGIADTNIKSTLAGSTSRNIIPYNKPEFFFYFAETQNNAFTIGAANWWFMSSTSPNEFALVRLSQKRNKRELKTGKVNVYAGSEIGIDSKSTIEFNIIQIDEHTFKVIPDQPLPPENIVSFIKEQYLMPDLLTNPCSIFQFNRMNDMHIIKPTLKPL